MNQQPQTFEGVRAVHLVGIGGSGVSALARLFALKGVRVTGSDPGGVREQGALERLGVTIVPAHEPGAVPENIDALIYSAAVPEHDPERTVARERGTPEYTYPEALGALMKGRYGVAVSGTNGKTTTTALLGLMVAEGGLDPTVVVGGTVPAWQGNFLFGQGDIFVAEGCEYRRHMLKLSPRMIVLTNIAADHLDYYRDINDIKDAFREYVKKLSADDVFVYNADDVNIADIGLDSISARKISFSLADSGALVCAANVSLRDGQQHFTLRYRGAVLGDLSARLPGDFNRANILAAAAAALELGVSFEAIQRAAAQFAGVRRRFEYVGEYHGAPVISDYAHHPDAVRGTVEATRELYPGKKVVAIFQPHQMDRTIKLFPGFVEALTYADTVILPEIYQVAGREEGNKVSSQDLVRAVNELKNGSAHYAEHLRDAQTIIERLNLENSAVLVMGAGDVDDLARMVVDIEGQ